MREVVANTDIRHVKGVYANSRFGWVPYLTSLAFILPVALLYCQLGGPAALLTDPNTGVHVRAGDWIVASIGSDMVYQILQEGCIAANIGP